MMSRRHFIKKMLAFLALLSGGGAVLAQSLNSDDVEESVQAPASFPSTDPSNDALFSFYLLSDLHVLEGISTMTDKLHSALKDITNFKSPVDMIILGGDLTDLGR